MYAEDRDDEGIGLMEVADEVEEEDEDGEEMRRPKTPRLLSSMGEKRTRARSEP